jgi:hypothetical protein
VRCERHKFYIAGMSEVDLDRFNIIIIGNVFAAISCAK